VAVKNETNSPAGGGVVKLNTASIKGESITDGSNDQKNAFEFLSGEKIELIDGTFFNSLQNINNKNLFIDKKTLFKNTTLSELEMFIKILNGAAVALGLLTPGNEIVLNENIKPIIKKYILNNFNTMQTKDPADRRIQPIFIMEVIKLMQEIGK